MPHVEAGSKVVSLNPTCTMMLRKEYPELLEGEDRERAKRLAEVVESLPNYFGVFGKRNASIQRFYPSLLKTPSPIMHPVI